MTHPAALLTRGEDSAAFTSAGALERLDVGGLSMLLYPASELEDGLAGLWLRRLTGDSACVHRLTGPTSGGTLTADEDAIRVAGTWEGLRWQVTFRFVGDDAWSWQVAVRNETGGPVETDLVWASDVALAPFPAVRINEYFVSQYLDLTPVDVGEHGVALAVRQNMPGQVAPWVLLGSRGRTVSWATDALQLVGEVDGRPGMLGLTRRRLPNERLQHEHTLAVLAEAPVTLLPGEQHATCFVARLVPDHPSATAPGDARHLGDACPPHPWAADAITAAATTAAPNASLFASPGFAARDLTLDEACRLLGTEPAGEPETGKGGWWSFVTADDESVVSAAKERQVLRPHGHILRTGHALTPTTASLTSTIWMGGVFASQVTQGHVARLKALSGRRTYLGLQQAHGLRVFVDAGEGWRLLVAPSAWGLRQGAARWLYTDSLLTVRVDAVAPTERDALTVEARVLAGHARVLVAMHLASGGDDGLAPDAPTVDLAPGRAVVAAGDGAFTVAWTGEATPGDDSALFPDGRSRGLPWLTLAADDAVALELTSDTVADDLAVPPAVSAPTDLWPWVRSAIGLELAEGPLADEVRHLDAVLPWFAHNALVHYLSPRGLEQYTGGGWGTRDVCQGPVGLLSALGQTEALTDVLLRIFGGQNDRGDWPQAFEFLPPPGAWEQFSAHGDVILWPLLATGEHLQATGDAALLERVVPFADGAARPVMEHLDRAVTLVETRTVQGRALPAYGHGDWNDSLQPADPGLADRMASTWTAVLQVQALRALAAGLRAADPGDVATGLARRCSALADATASELRELLLVDGLLAGYGVFGQDGALEEILVHPRDTRTGLTYGVLPWIHAIAADLLTPEEAASHLDVIAEHLLGPDGARLFDKPAAYRGGPLDVFRRAEAATFFGREIGLMYTHAHLRYAEALARVGDGPGLFRALALGNPRGLTHRVPSARPRQNTCYYSSSDAAFRDRYEAAQRYGEVRTGDVPLEGGWRIYSSGPGLALRITVECLLGVRVRGDRVEIDPVLDPALDGLRARVSLPGSRHLLTYRITGSGVGVTSVTSGGADVATIPLSNPYRRPGVSVARRDLVGEVTVTLG